MPKVKNSLLQFPAILAIVIVYLLQPQFATGKELSNRLPLELVRTLSSNQLWLPEFDDNSVVQEHFFDFLSSIQSGNSSEAQTLFFLDPTNNHPLESNSPLYQAKVMTLRWSSSQNNNSQIAAKAILEKYFEMSLSMIATAQIQEMNTILTNAKQLYFQKTLKLVDLSPAQRVSIAKDTHLSHVQTQNIILAKIKNAYAVNGVYQQSTKTLAIDISRGISETIITLAHELVHAADPENEFNNSQVKRLLPIVQKKLVTALKTNSLNVTNEGIQNLLEITYNELNPQSLSIMMDELRSQRAEQIKTDLEKIGLQTLADDVDLKDFNRAIVQRTLGNEIKAYMLSLATYKQLQGNLALIPFSQERERYLDDITTGELRFTQNLSASMNPFHRAGTTQDLQNFNTLRSILESHYINATRETLGSISSKYSRLIAEVKGVQKSHPELSLPEWTQPGKLDSSLNPYTILTAKFSTLWAVRFKEVADNFVSDLQDMNVSLLNLKMGILDFHDLTFGELKLLGIHSAQADQGQLPETLDSKFKSDIAAQPKILKKYFSLAQWQPNNPTSQGALLQNDVAGQLVKLRLLKTLHYLDTDFPEMKTTLLSSKVFLSKLTEGLYDVNEISETRAEELKQELINSTKAAELSTTEAYTMNQLLISLTSFYELASKEGWNQVADKYSIKMKSAISLLEKMGFESKYKINDLKSLLDQDLQQYKNKIAKDLKFCAKTDALEYIPGTPEQTLHNKSFKLTAICFQKNLYLFRQPGDYNKSATTFIQNGRPESKIFIGARPIRLEPAIEYKSSFFGGVKWK